MEFSQSSNVINVNERMLSEITPDIANIDNIKKMAFIYNALEEGWHVVKKIDRYIFTKKHEGRKEVLSDDYLEKFIVKNISLDKLIQ